MRAATIIFTLLGAATVAEMARVHGELGMQAEMLGRLQAPEAASDAPEVGAASARVEFSKLPFAEAIDFFRRKEVMTPDEFSRMADRYRARGFAIAGVYDRRVLETAHEAILDTLREGGTERQAVAKIRAAIAEAGCESPGGHHLQTVFDQNVLGSYAAGRWAQLTHPDVIKARPYWRYRTAGDSRVRPAHRAMDGKVFPADSDVWLTWYPPNGWRCRCGVESLSAAEVDKEGVVVERELPPTVQLPDGTVAQMVPDPGFNGSPATQAIADRAVSALRQQASALGLLGPDAAGLDRANDSARRALVDRWARLDEAAVEKQLRATPIFHVMDPAPEPATGEAHVTWFFGSQDLDSVEQLVARIVQAPRLAPLRDRIEAVGRASYHAAWAKAPWPTPSIVHDDELAQRLGVETPLTAARATQLGLRLVCRPGELAPLLALLQDGGDQHGEAPVRRAWAVQDLQLRMGHLADLPPGEGWARVYVHTLNEMGGRELHVLDREPDRPFDGRRAPRVHAIAMPPRAGRLL